MTNSLVFFGFMGAGKSTAARAAAEQLGTEPIDTDELLEAEFGSSIAEFFNRHGESEFRKRESALVVRVLSESNGQPVALGGGAVLSQAVRDALAPHTAVLLEVDEEVAWKRVSRSDRPLARSREEFAELLASRKSIYESVADAFVPASGSRLRRGELAALRQLQNGPIGMRLAWARAATGNYPVYFGPGSVADGFWPLQGESVVVTDAEVDRLLPHVAEGALLRATVEPGEQSKSVAEAERVWSAFAQAGVDHETTVIALGGGVVGDLAGFCAATYQRGIKFVQVPTTLVAQVDSAYGGKTGIDLPEGKNYVGSYHQPAAVLTDPILLNTLPKEEVAAGYAEVVKTALIAGGELWDRVAGGASPTDPEVVWSCLRTKLAVVAADERDGGLRQVLNLGHTVGHAIETVTSYSRFRHGEAVGLGLLAAISLSTQPELRMQVASLLAANGLPTTTDGLDARAVLQATAVDKKRRGGKVGFVLVQSPGSVSFGNEVAPESVLQAIEELLQ